MTGRPKTCAWLQIHLSTAIVLMFVAGGLMWLNFQRWPESLHFGVDGPGFRANCPLYGWPFFSRYSVFTLDGEEATIEVATGDHWHWPHVAADVGVALSILVIVAIGLEWAIRRKNSL